MPARSVSLARKFAGTVALLAGAAVVLVAAGAWWWIDRLEQASALSLQRKDVELRAAQVRDTLVRIEERLVELSASPLLSTALTDSLGRDTYLLPYLGSIQVINAVPIELLLVDFAGQEIARNGDLTFSKAQRATLQAMLDQGRSSAVVTTDGDREEVLFAVMTVYPRTKTVEGALWLKLALSDLLRAPGYRLVAAGRTPIAPATGTAPPDALQAPVELSGSLAQLGLGVIRDAPPPPPVRDNRLVWSLLAITLMLVVAVGLIGRRLARRMTADLGALEKFAGAVEINAFGATRAPVTGPREVASLAGSINRMLDRLNQQHSTLRSETQVQLHLLATCIANLNDIVMITEARRDLDGGHRIVFVNEAFVRLTGYSREEVIGKTPSILQGPDTDRAELDRIAASLKRWEPVRAEVVNYTKSGERFWIEMEIVPVKDASGWVTNWVSVERDATARREAEAVRRGLESQIREAQKMEAIGTLAGGIAHDFNNILAAILGNLALAREELASGLKPVERLDQIGRSAGRARSLVQQILTYSRRQSEKLAPQDMRLVLTEVIEMLRATVPARVLLEQRITDEPVTVLGESTALQQVVMNLGTNAWQALRGSTGTIVLGLELIAEAAAPAGLGRSAGGRCVHLWVADNGCGMDETTRARIFEPFFTTKKVGTGTGLGLSVVQGIVRSHGGVIAVDSAPAEGSVFHVYLPRCDQEVAALASTETVSPKRGTGQHVLYVDDDDVMVAMAQALLESWGYRVTAMHGAADAIAAIRADPDLFDLVVTDFNMPGLSGLDVLREVSSVRAGLPVILTSGYIADDVRDEAVAAGAIGLLQKENIHEELATLAASALRTR